MIFYYFFIFLFFFFFKQKTAYEISSRDWSSDVCSSDLRARCGIRQLARLDAGCKRLDEGGGAPQATGALYRGRDGGGRRPQQPAFVPVRTRLGRVRRGDDVPHDGAARAAAAPGPQRRAPLRGSARRVL